MPYLISICVFTCLCEYSTHYTSLFVWGSLTEKVHLLMMYNFLWAKDFFSYWSNSNGVCDSFFINI